MQPMTDVAEISDLESILKQMGGLRGLDDLKFSCPNTGIPLPGQEVQVGIVVPDDVDGVIALLDGTLNSFKCVCGASHHRLAPVMALFRPTGAAICVTAGAPLQQMTDVMKQLGPPFSGATFTEDYDGLLRSVLGWLNQMLAHYGSIVLNETLAKRPRRERIASRSPTLLVYLRDLAEGRWPVTVMLHNGRAPPDVAREAHAALYTGSMVEQFNDLIGEFGPGGLIGEARSRIPRRAISENILTQFANVARKRLEMRQSPAAGADVAELFSRAYGAGMINAVAHSLAGRQNPETPGWAALVRQAWRGWGSIDDNPLLAPAEAGPRLIGFEPLWDHCRHELAAAPDISTFDDIERMFARLGHGDRFRAIMETNPIAIAVTSGEDGAIEFERFTVDILSQILRQHPLGDSPAESGHAGEMAGAALQLLAGTQQPEATLRFASSFIKSAIDADDPAAAFTFGTRAIPTLCRADRLEDAGQIARRLTELWHEPSTQGKLRPIKPRVLVSFWNECGSLMRYVGRPDEALRSYEISRAFLALVDDATARDDDGAVLDRNEALALRDLGRFSEALPRIAALADMRPGDPAAQTSLALLHLQTGQVEQAEAAAEAAVLVSDPVVAPLECAIALVIRASARQLQGEHASALADLTKAMDLTSGRFSLMSMRIAACACQIKSARLYQPGLIAQAEKLLRDAVETGASNRYQLERVAPTALYGLGLLLLNENRQAELELFDRKHLSPFLNALGEEAFIDWRLLRLKGAIEHDATRSWTKTAWGYLSRALSQINSETPKGRDVDFAAGWLADKDALQLETAAAAIAMVECGAVPAEVLLDIYELSNGRDFAATLEVRRGMVRRYSEPEAFPGPAEETNPLDALKAAAAKIGRDILLVACIDTPDEVHIVSLLASEGACKLHGSWPADHVETTGLAFTQAMESLNPAAPHDFEARFKTWATLMDEFGAAIEPCLPLEALIAFLPGRRMTNLPLHLSYLPARRREVLREHPVIYSANSAILLDQAFPTERRKSRSLVVAAAKAGDSRQFRANLACAARRIARESDPQGRTGSGFAGPSLIGQAPYGRGINRRGPVWRISGRRATAAAVMAGLAETEAIFLLCHGARIGQRKGYGFYLSDGSDLPPALAVDLEAAPEMSRFALAWQDFANASAAPSLIVSAACSSGRTVVTAGGARIGPEAAAFAKGTRCVVAPLWNVEQDAALDWMEAFQKARMTPDGAPAPIWDAHRQACLDVRAKYPHPFFWAPFIATGCLSAHQAS